MFFLTARLTLIRIEPISCCSHSMHFIHSCRCSFFSIIILWKLYHILHCYSAYTIIVVQQSIAKIKQHVLWWSYFNWRWALWILSPTTISCIWSSPPSHLCWYLSDFYLCAVSNTLLFIPSFITVYRSCSTNSKTTSII